MFLKVFNGLMIFPPFLYSVLKQFLLAFCDLLKVILESLIQIRLRFTMGRYDSRRGTFWLRLKLSFAILASSLSFLWHTFFYCLVLNEWVIFLHFFLSLSLQFYSFELSNHFKVFLETSLRKIDPTMVLFLLQFCAVWRVHMN